MMCIDPDAKSIASTDLLPLPDLERHIGVGCSRIPRILEHVGADWTFSPRLRSLQRYRSCHDSQRMSSLTLLLSSIAHACRWNISLGERNGIASLDDRECFDFKRFSHQTDILPSRVLDHEPKSIMSQPSLSLISAHMAAIYLPGSRASRCCQGHIARSFQHSRQRHSCS